MKSKLAVMFLVGAIVGYFAGREHLKYEMKSAATEAIESIQKRFKETFSPPAVEATNAINVAETEVIEQRKREREERERAEAEMKAKAEQARLESEKLAAAIKKAKIDYATDSLEVSNLRSEKYKDLIDGEVPGVWGELRNKGDRVLKRVQVTAYFLDANGKEIFENSYGAVHAGGLDNEGPLKPNYIRKFGFKSKGVPAQWDEGRIRLAITDIEFEE